MINFLRINIFIFIILIALPKSGFSQACVTPSINAQVGTGPTTVICLGQCANLTASVVPPQNSTTTYSVASIAYTTFPYSGGNNAFASSLDDTWSDVIDIGFNFCYFGNNFNKLVVGSNGEITFDQSVANTPESWVCSTILPNLIEHPGNTICGAYRDYNPSPGGVIRTYTTGTAPCRAFIMYWSSVTLFGCGTPVSSFQIVLYEGSNRIGVNIQNSTACLSWNGGRGLIGIQNALGTAVVAPATRNVLTPWTAINESWVFVPTAPPLFSVNWAGPSGFTASGLTAAPCPTATGNYTATMSYCTGSVSSVVQVSVGTPPVFASASSNTICPPASATLTGSGATSYTWQTPTGNIIGSTALVSPTSNTTYTLIGSNGICTNSTTILISVTPPPTVSAFNLSGTICSGSSANCVATGALTYTWNPGAIVGNIVSLSPVVTTTYTVIGSNGGCLNTTTLVVPVSNGPTLTVTGTPTAICPGNSATLSAIGALGYTWNPGGTIASSIIVSPLVTTNYSVTGINVFGCTSTYTIDQVVSPVPNVTITPATSSICIGSSITLTATGASSYTWNPGGLTTAVVALTPTTTTTYTIVGSNGTCTNSTTSLLTIVPIPTVSATSSTTEICSGGAVTLNGFGATSYTWNPGGLTGASVIDSPTITTTYTVIGSTSTCTNNAVITVTVHNGPVMLSSVSPTNICAGSSATLSSSGALSYTWNPGALSGGTVVVSPSSTTTYSVTGDNIFGCITTETINLNVTPNPTVTASASSSSICIGSNATLTANGASSYTWNPGAFIGGNFVVSPAVNTTYTLDGITAGCSGQTTIAISVVPVPTVTAVSSSTAICSGNSATLTASGATNYTWNPGALTGSNIIVSPSTTTNYTVIGNNGSCSSTTAVNLVVNTTPTLIATANPTSVCTSGNVTLTVTGANSYTWNPGALTGSNVTVFVSLSTTYTVIGTSASGCTNSANASVTVNTIPVLTAAASPTSICVGGSATLTGNGATSYTWNPGALSGNTVVVSPIVNTIYTLTGSNGTCVNTRTLILIVHPNPTLTAIANPTNICAGSSATLSATGAPSYTWNPGPVVGGTITVSPLSTTLYTVTGRSPFGCISTRTVNLIVTPIPTVVPVASPTAVCIGSSSTLTATGATNYTWNPGALTGSNVSVSPLINTTYTVIGSTGICSNTQTLNVLVNPIPTLALAATPTAICFGGSGTLTASGASNYTWNPGALTGSNVIVSPTITTNYTVTGANAFGCTNTATVNLIVNPNPTLTVMASPTAICSGNSSTLSGTAIGGGPFVSVWNPGAVSGSSIIVSPAISTTYTWNVTNSFACSQTETITLNVTPTPTVVASATNATICAGASTTLSAVGATSYTWNPGAIIGSNITVSPLINTTYTVNGANGSCITSQTIGIVVNPTPTLTAIVSPTNICPGSTATLSSSGATSYTWNPGAIIGGTVTDTPTSTTLYTVTGSSTAGCISTETVNLIVTPNPTVNTLATPTAVCLGNSSTLTATGATNYTWNPGALTGSNVVVAPLVNTTYTVDGSNGVCTNSQTVSVVVNTISPINATALPNSICAGQTITLTVVGALTYTWNPGALTGSLVTDVPLITTTYSVTGTDLNGCTNNTVVTVTVNALPTLTAISTPTNICEGSTATLSASGATSYTWNPGAIVGGTITDTPASTTLYTVTGSSAAGCVSTETVNLIVTPNPTVIPVATPTAVCLGNSSTLTATGATNYTWNPGAITGSNVVVTPLINTTYTVSGDNGICANSQTVSVIVNTIAPIAVGALPNPICAGQTVSLSAVGALTYTWNPGALMGSLVTDIPLITTTYSVTGTDLNGCTNNTVVTVTVNALPTLTISSTATTICSGGSATLTANGAASYTWNPGALTSNTVSVNPTSTTNYSLEGSSASGCTNTATFNLSVTPTPTVVVSASSVSICAGSSSTLTATGASNYTWNPGAIAGSSIVVSPIVSTTYTVDGESGICSNSQTISIVVNPSPTVTIGSTGTVICSSTQLTLTANGANTYTWLPPIAAISQTIIDTPLSNTSYTVNGTDINGCTNQAVFNVTVNTTPTVTINVPLVNICSGQTATLVGMGATNYTWLPGGSNATILTTPLLVPTTYTLIGSNAFCESTATITLIPNANPTITANSSSVIICSGNTVSLTAGGANTYSWNPIGLTGATVTNSPTSNTTYSVIGTDLNGCSSQALVTVSVNPSPTVIAVPSSTSVCLGGTATLSASGALSYTWSPGLALGGTITVTPTITTSYTVVGEDAIGCNNTQTLSLVVLPNPTVTAVGSSTGICSGNSATLTAGGASTYTWEPGAITTSVTVISPTTTTIYTLTGSNGICGMGTTTLIIIVNTPPIATGGVSGSITCATSSVDLIGSSTPTTVTYLWNGPGSYTSSVQSPTGIAIPGDYTLVVTDAAGCTSSATTAIVTDTNVPTVSVTINGTITCANNSVTITALTSVTNASYSWTGPSAFTNTNSIITVSVGGNYSLTITDLNASCPASTIITVFTNTSVPITATLIPATCSGTATNNDATIITAGFVTGDRYDFVVGSTYTGTATYITATNIPVSGVLTNTISNPFAVTPHTVRFFGANGCIKDTTMFLTPTSCLTNTVFGIAKAVSSPTIQTNGTYNVTYKVVVKNTGAVALNNVVLTENLANTFPLPTTFSIISAPTIITAGTSLTLDATFDGTLQTTLTNTLSVLNANTADTILFSLNINPNGKFGPFNNTVIGFSQPIPGVVLRDSSNVGIDPDPDGDGNPTNNNIPTPLNLAPNLFFGVTKVGAVSDKLSDNTYDISYTITVHNLGNDTLHNIVLKDSLFNSTIKQPASYTLKSGPVPTGSLVANTNFNGNTDINLTIPSQSKLPPGFVNSISFTINVTPDTMTVIKNSAFGRALSSSSIAVTDTSGNGINPDINGNGVWNETVDNIPTVLTIPNNTLFVPQGFSPNDDLKNDTWVIKGLPVGIENTVTVFNRWGNKVYQKTNYDNTWTGFPNVSGTLGNEKLPQGTYYYIIEFKSSEYKALNGFVILQY
ncbi:MAG: gliding motility-associated C-terminal domain-containing protein [Bacteroidota bacterium]|nr:gliding motility-associated C-terminal domain-containing protein [Bacteroidota bacterium]